jgi:hypothetical protein
MTLFQDNLSPYLTAVEQGSTPANPASGNQKLFVRTSDHVLCYVNSSGTVAPVSAAIVPVISDATLGAAVTLTTINTYYDGPSLSLVAGTYVIWGQVDISPGTVVSYAFLSARIDSGGTVIAEAGNVALLSGTEIEIFMVGTVVLGTTTTVKIRAAWGPAGGGSASPTMERDISANSATTHTATHLVALRIA